MINKKEKRAISSYVASVAIVVQLLFLKPSVDIRLLQVPLCDESENAGGADSLESHDLAASLNAEIRSGVRERDVELTVVNADALESDTSPIHIISEARKERFLFFFSQ